jgi:hypothetical protein
MLRNNFVVSRGLRNFCSRAYLSSQTQDDIKVVIYLPIAAPVVQWITFGALIAFREWEEWINCGLGVWIAVSPWVLGFQHTAGMFVNLAIGVLIAYLALLDLWLFHYGSSSEEAM